ncbi:DNA polymerase beta palm [Rhizoctonia solani]|uniref:DNA polymerase beta palm n=1 Tax=Rhizoctonia solani TaxID=456999 RepID=A0A8H8P9K9_9AGAM|nr:DNA polymerase beta palm [Rhizoctonia solani]QRW26318.1 DNA polymerase beta palm [Rhizoctonia solani]
MPRSEAAEIFQRIKAVALNSTPCSTSRLWVAFGELILERVQGKQTCGDVDILMTRPTNDGKSHRGMLLNKLLPVLHSQQLLSHDLAVPDDENDLEAKYMGLCQLHSDTLMRRIGMLGVYATMFAGPEVNVCLQTS